MGHQSSVGLPVDDPKLPGDFVDEHGDKDVRSLDASHARVGEARHGSRQGPDRIVRHVEQPIDEGRR